MCVCVCVSDLLLPDSCVSASRNADKGVGVGGVTFTVLEIYWYVWCLTDGMP